MREESGRVIQCIFKSFPNAVSTLVTLLGLFLLVAGGPLPAEEDTRGNVIFIHPDGVGVTVWNAARILSKGPDGDLNWDRLPVLGVYRSHTATSLSTTSHAGATMHAFGVKVPRDSFGMWGRSADDEARPLTALSGQPMSIMKEAQKRGFACALINSGSIVEPGTAVFVVSHPSRRDFASVTEKVVQSGVEVIFSGGEEWMLPEGVQGVHGTGKRKDGKNLIKWAREHGYHVIYRAADLKQIPEDVTRVLGVFSVDHTFNAETEEVCRDKRLPLFKPATPTVADMTRAALTVLERTMRPCFVVVEEEGTDNFANRNHAMGVITALLHADEAIGVAMEHLKTHPNSLLLVASDSEAGGMELVGEEPADLPLDEALPETDRNGAPIDGREGTRSQPFLSAPDRHGRRFPFRIMWSTDQDTYGSVLVRAAGHGAEYLHGTVDNTDIYRAMYFALFGKKLPSHVVKEAE